MPGTYTVVAEEAEWDDYEADIDDRPFTLPPTSFSMRLPLTKTTLKAKPAGKNVRLTVQVKDERPAGYFSTEYATVRLEVQARGKWRTVPRSKTITDDRGREVSHLQATGLEDEGTRRHPHGPQRAHRL